ncbi:phage major tail tube protein [Pseudobutyrivibrio sp.]|uniref:phage major tail tube protein n=1 Tax=Pseudobutyrivibrio sp. TaxID=2014367 RepID=UPI001B605908|nr:phage major tail tube protein [Pseudobutyrivibrio sp.]MBP3261089.1 phage major tail tube protein [Pseudobutyrivibrio sp.]
MSYIPGKINNFNLYQGTASESSKLLGVTAEVTLPNFQYVSETLNMAGMAGEIDDPSAGQLQSSTIEIPFSNISRENIDLARNDQIPLIMRAAQEMINKDTGAKEYKGRVITVKGMTKAINYGSLQKNGYGNPSITKEVTYYKEEIDGEVITEIDKINGICKINGTDVVDNISNLI